MITGDNLKKLVIRKKISNAGNRDFNSLSNFKQ